MALSTLPIRTARDPDSAVRDSHVFKRPIDVGGEERNGSGLATYIGPPFIQVNLSKYKQRKYGLIFALF
jgi:hypothetical protein